METQEIKITVKREDPIIPDEVQKELGLKLTAGGGPRGSENLTFYFIKDIAVTNEQIKSAIEKAVPGIIIEVSDDLTI